MNLFGKKKPKPNMNESILHLRETIQQLEKRENHLAKQADQCMESAKAKSKKKDKRGALFELKRKKMFEKQIEQIFGKRVNLETQIMALESAATNKDVVSAMQMGKNAIDASLKSADIDNVADVMDGIDDSLAMAEELDTALSQPLGNALADDDLEAELAELEEQEMQEQMLSTPSVPVSSTRKVDALAGLASPPTGVQAEPENQIDADLAALEAEFAV